MNVQVTSNQALKAAKKLLKKRDSKSMKLKSLAKLVADKLGENGSHKQVKEWIKKSDKFLIDGKEVKLSKKRCPSLTPEGSNKKAKKSKKSSSDEAATTTRSASDIAEWRKNNKIVLKHAKDNDEGKKETESINKDKLYYPFISFEDPICKEVIADSLLRQCTEGNSFEKPSPIQAQSWSILMSKKNGRKRDVVGIAETGKN
jgi:hypothetical protein